MPKKEGLGGQAAEARERSTGQRAGQLLGRRGLFAKPHSSVKLVPLFSGAFVEEGISSSLLESLSGRNAVVR